MLSDPSFRLVFVFIINSSILSGFSFTSFHLAEASLSHFSWLYTHACAVVHKYTKYQSTSFVCTTWKLTQTMEQQPQHACEPAKAKQKQDQVTSHSNWPRILLFDLAHKQRNGIIKWWFHCLTSESKERFFVNECVPLTISYHLYFLRISKVSSMLHHGSVWQAHSKECYFNFAYNFLALFCYFLSKNFCFYPFHFLFWWSIKFPQQNINQSVIETGDDKLSETVCSNTLMFGSAWCVIRRKSNFFLIRKK